MGGVVAGGWEVSRAHSVRERLMLFHRGFGDGARASAKKLPNDEDYMAGWKRGSEAVTDAVGNWSRDEGILPDAFWILREDS